MRQVIVIALILTFLAGGLAWAGAFSEKDPYDYAVKKVFSEPDEKSKLVYEIPIEVKLLDVSEDADWYKVKISFDLGILGKYTYQGWTKIPVGTILVSRK